MRYLPHTQEDIDQMLAVTGHASLDDLFETIPDELKTKEGLNLLAAIIVHAKPLTFLKKMLPFRYWPKTNMDGANRLL